MLTTQKLKGIEPSVFAGGNRGKKPTQEIIAKTIKKIVKEFGQDPQSINSGECDRFAEELVARLKYGYAMETIAIEEEDFDEEDEYDVDLADVPNHAFVQIGDRYYDAETPKGVANWWDLPVYKRFKFQENQDHPRRFLRESPSIGSESFEQWIFESKRSERIANRKRVAKEQNRSVEKGLKCTSEDPCDGRKWELERGHKGIYVTGLQDNKFCIWCNRLYEP